MGFRLPASIRPVGQRVEKRLKLDDGSHTPFDSVGSLKWVEGYNAPDRFSYTLDPPPSASACGEPGIRVRSEGTPIRST